MASKLFFALLLSLFLVSQVTSDAKKNEESSHVFRRGDKKLMREMLEISKYLKDGLVSRSLSLAPTPTPAPAPAPGIDCDGLCKKRCSLHSRQNVCLRACGTCCDRCKCVPPGTFGNREKCGTCYTNMTTHGNRSKCP